MALLYASIFPLVFMACATSNPQEEALLQWKASLADANSLSSWSPTGSSTCCSWLGVTCDAAGHVVELSLPSAGLRGQLDSFDFAAFPNLTKLNLNNNSLVADNNLTGSIPTGFGNMTSMMHQNKEQFIISVDKSASYPYFNRIHVNWKGHDGIFQREVALVTGIDLSSNFLSGEIPTELSNLQGLKFVNLSRNHLSGGIPKDIGNLTFLESLDLSVNQLSGPIPSSITNLMSLSSLNLSSNNLSGEIPKGNQLQTLDDPSIYGNNSGLCGFPLSIKCPNNSSSVSAFNKQKEYHKDLEDLWLCYWVVAGFIFGLWVWLGGLIFFKAWRMAIFGYMDRLKNIVM
ncbi:hypothetical protein C2845_PM02G07590 [Panicum miliaceum]|uniref:Leucine-rich repeat-containing N-terminal plant-type domain-containing protein n=1 Tax=Panicum miliaceum TaxID=4540 RepID=A0A3L6S912_PANMI|nr:hypothetical protein C2845_PM02G07590 [Panicum miliaceum]